MALEKAGPNHSLQTTGLQTGPLAWLRRSAAGNRVHGWALAFFTVASLLMTYPLVLHMAGSVVDQVGDNIYFIFLIRWYQKAWLELGISPFFSPFLNYPQGWNLASTDTSLATTLPGLPASLLFGPTFGYNFALLITFVLSGWAMFAWVRRLSGSALAGLVGGFLYAFLPYRVAHYQAGHLNLVGTAWFPLYFMGLYDLLRAKQGWSVKSLALAAGMLALIGFTSMYYLYMTLLFSALFVAAYLALVDWRAVLQPGWWKRLLAFAAASLPGVLAAAAPFLGFNNQGGLASRTLEYASQYSASPTDFFLPSTAHFLLGRWVGATFDRSMWIEGTLYFGVVALALAALAWIKRAEGGNAGLMKIALVVAAGSFLLALGVRFHWLGQEVSIPVPAAVETLLRGEPLPIMPARILFKYLPFFDKMRALMRFGFFALLFNTLAAGLGAAWVIKRAGPRRALLAAALLLALAFLDFYPAPAARFEKVAPRPVDEWLAAQPGQGAVAQFPASQLEDQDQVYNSLFHGKPYIGGFFSANQPEQYLRIRPVLETFPSRAGADLLRDLGVGYVLFSTAKYPDFAAVRSQVESLGFDYITTISGEAVFEPRAP